jgi:transcriptional regulator with PAS, ATPase and Fis domain
MRGPTGAGKREQNENDTDVYGRLNLVGKSWVFRQALEVIERIAAVDVTVLVQGETGTGKELAARALHYLSPRRDFPFIPVNCGALPDNLLESELFGHVRGAFTDAKQSNEGLVAQAEGGTLFLDEVEAMTPRAQIVLLRFLQDHKYRPVGGRLLSAGNVRVIASTNIDLEHLVLQNKFRRDLLFRLSILLVTMPPLRRRTGDVLLLAEYFLHRFAAEHARSTKHLHPHTVSSLLAYDWPGNVRELENMMLRELLLTDGDLITTEPHRRLAAENVTANGFDTGQTFKTAKARAIAEFERSFLGHLLVKTGGNISLAARICGKDRSSLNKLVKKHGLADEGLSSSLG